MHEPTVLGTKIDSLLEAATQSRANARDHIRQRMMEIEQRTDQFNKVAAIVMGSIIRPRIEVLAGKFDNASLVDTTVTGGHRSMCVFGHTDRFPASTELEFAVQPDERMEQIVISYRLGILPVFVSFKGQDQLAMPLQKIDHRLAAAWVEERLVEFVDTYLQLETAKQYQDENVETDPVCGMAVNRNWAAAQMEYEGRTYYFCLEECRRRFAEAPRRFAVTKAQESSSRS